MMPGVATGRFGQQLFAAMRCGVSISIGVFSVWWGICTCPVFGATRVSITPRTASSTASCSNVRSCKPCSPTPMPRKEPGRVRRLSEALRSFGLALSNRPSWLKNPSLPARSSINWARPSGALCPPLRQIHCFGSRFFCRGELKDDHNQEDFAYLKMSYLGGPARRLGREPTKSDRSQPIPRTSAGTGRSGGDGIQGSCSIRVLQDGCQDLVGRVGPSATCCCVASRTRRTRQSANGFLGGGAWV